MRRACAADTAAEHELLEHLRLHILLLYLHCGLLLLLVWLLQQLSPRFVAPRAARQS